MKFVYCITTQSLCPPSNIIFLACKATIHDLRHVLSRVLSSIRSTVLSKSRGKMITNPDQHDPLFMSSDLMAGAHTSTCGHVMHADCWQRWVLTRVNHNLDLKGLAQETIRCILSLCFDNIIHQCFVIRLFNIVRSRSL